MKGNASLMLQKYSAGHQLAAQFITELLCSQGCLCSGLCRGCPTRATCPAWGLMITPRDSLPTCPEITQPYDPTLPYPGTDPKPNVCSWWGRVFSLCSPEFLRTSSPTQHGAGPQHGSVGEDLYLWDLRHSREQNPTDVVASLPEEAVAM